MNKFLLSVLGLIASASISFADDYQLPNSNLEDWSAPAYDGQPQAKYWNASNVSQVGLKFNFAHRESGHNGGYCMMVQDQSVGAMGITETSPAYFSLGTAWQKLEGLNTGSATAGTYGGYGFTHRPDSVSVWIKRTGNKTDKEDFHILYYAWSGTAKGSSYKNKNGGCTSVSWDDEESDIRIALNGNECKTDAAGGQVSEGWWRERKTYGQWTNIRVPIYYMNDNAPKKCNLIFSASNYPNFRANDGLYEGNSLYVDDIELIYSSKIDKLLVGEKEWKGFDPNSKEVQIYALGEHATEVPDIVAYRGVGALTNPRGKTVNFPGRKLSGSEISIVKGNVTNTPTVITVKSEDGKKTTVYKIQFQKAASSNAKLAGISVNGAPITGFSASKYNYNIELPYGTTAAPVVEAERQEDAQTLSITQASSVTGTATILVTAADRKSTATYTLTFKVGLLADNTLQDIKVNGTSVAGFTPTQTNYKVSLPVGTSAVPTIEAVSAYPAGAQTVEYVLPSLANLDGGSAQIKVSTPGNTTPKIYKLNFKLEASSYSYLKDIRINNILVADFEPTNLTYYISLPLGTTSLPAITWTKGDEYQTVTKEEGGLDGITRITVTAGNGDKTIYKLVFSTQKSEISILNGIKIGGVALSDFRPEVTNYSYELPIGTTELPEIEAVPYDDYQTITITKGNVNGTTRIAVTAGNGSTTIYLITFSVDAYTDNTLKSIKVDGAELEGFDPEVNEYNYSLPQGTTELPEVTIAKQDEDLQTVTVRNGGVNGDYRITVRPQSGASRTYIIHFSVATSSNTKLTMIRLDGTDLQDFDPEVLEYHVTLPEGVSAIPAVSFEKAESTQRVLNVLEDTVQIITVTAQSGVKREYKVYFKIQLSANAFLDMIYLDGTPLAGFDPQQMNYKLTLASTTCPKITVDKAAGQQVTITTPVGAGKAVILVAPEQGATNTYTITFEEVPATSVQLQNIFINGTALAGFDPTKSSYTATYEKTQPTITYSAESGQTVAVMWIGETAWLHVSDAQGTTASYSITFTRRYIGNASLGSIKADGVQLADWDASKRIYNYTLAAGSTYPTISYEKGDPTQVVAFGQIAEGTWRMHVTAENGDTTSYTVKYSIAKSSDATLENIELIGLPAGQTFTFDPANNTANGGTLDEGAELPDVQVTAKTNQRVVSYNANDDEQDIQVTSEDGTTNTYKITYARKQSSNAKLAGILVDGARLMGFDAENNHYSVTLPKGTTVMPNVFPMAQLDNQTITTYYGGTNGVTRIHVEAQDGTAQDYLVTFNVEKSHNTKLGRLIIDGVDKDVNTTDYTFDVPFGTVNPYEVNYKPAEEGQLIHYIEAPINGETKIIVTSESGEATRTYSIRYNVAVPEGANLIKKVNYSYVDKSDAVHTGSITPNKGENIVDLPYGAKSFEITGYEKNYNEQAVTFYNGGIRRGAKLIAVSNREGENEVEYTIVPRMPEYDNTGKLSDLKFKGTTVPNFRPDVYNYIVNVTAQPAASDFTYTAYDGKTVTKSALDNKKKQITLTVSGGETYSICWFYANDKDPFDFSNTWVSAGSTGSKPSADWVVVADKTSGHTYEIAGYPIPYTSGLEVSQSGENAVLLASIRQAAIRATIPGMMTLGDMSVTVKSGSLFGCNSSSSVTVNATNGVTFRNTPEQLTFQYNALSGSGINAWSVKVWMSNGSALGTVATYSGNYSASGLKNAAINLNYPSGNVAYINATLNSCGTENIGSMGGLNDNQSSRLLLQNMHLTYNSALNSATVNGKATTKSGNTFTYTLGANEVISGIPSLKFTGAVHDQMQTIEWLNNGEWVNGELKAKVVNYGENAFAEKRDSTIYTVVLKRNPVTSLDYTATFGSYATTEKGDTTFINMPYGTKALPDFHIEPESVHQLFDIQKKNNNITVTVKAENGTSKKTVYVFREMKSNEVDLDELSLEDAHGNSVSYETTDAAHYIYKVTANEMANIVYMKKTDGQKVDLNYTANGATLTITAEDGKTKRTHTFNLVAPTITSNAQISAFEIAGTPMQELGGNTTSCEKDKPADAVSFALAYPSDSVVFIQSPAKMEWQVYGSVNKTYTWTYPTTPSTNALLGNIKVNGADYSEFQPTMFDYSTTPICSDSTVYITTVAAEKGQQITIGQTFTNNGIDYSIQVTAADGSTSKTYKLRIDPNKSDDKRLANILVDGAALSGFDADKLNYTVTLPSRGAKRTQPKMPSISYLVGQQGQSVELTPGQVGELDPTLINVTSEKGSNQEYSVTVLAEPSHCAELTGIMINGKALNDFESGRHYYSMELNTANIDVQYASDDRFQTVQVLENGYNRTIRVTAEDGTTVSEYFVNIYVQTQSSDATLSNILLEQNDQMVELVDFQRALNPSLKFEPMQHSYDIALPAGSTVAPAVSAQLKMDGQTVEISKNKMVVTIKVFAVDGTPNEYTLNFVVPKSKDADLGMIFLNGDSLKGFTPDYYFYQVELPVGVHSLPEVGAQKGESRQTVVIDDPDLDKQQVLIHTAAEDTTMKNTYVVVFHYTRSDVNTLRMIYADGDSLRGFEPTTFFYNDSLPVGTTAFPNIEPLEGDDWQRYQIDTLLSDQNNLLRQIQVTSERGKKNTYTVSYTICKSAVDTLQMIYVDKKPLAGFSARQNEYTLTLSAAEANALNGALPEIEALKVDTTQTVLVSQAPDSLSGKSLGYKSLITVTAASGNMRIYTIHYNVEQSSDASLNMIMLAGKPIDGFDAQKTLYRLNIDSRATLPAVTVVKKEEAQTYEMSIHGDSIIIDVRAEDGTMEKYTLAFNRELSDNAQVQSIKVEGHPEFLYNFASNNYDYTQKLQIGEDTIPAVTVLVQDTLQTVMEPYRLDTLDNGDIKMTISVFAPNGSDEADYTIIFQFVKNNNALLNDIILGSQSISNFQSQQTDYIYAHPYGSTADDFFGPDSVSYVLSDSLATATVTANEDGTIMITVVAQDGTTESTYTIRQIIAKDNDCALKAIMLDDVMIRDFDPEITFYTYFLREGDVPPYVSALPRSENAEEPSIGVAAANDTCRIICTAEDGTERRYYIHFAVSSINSGLAPTPDDVLIKRVPSTFSLFAASIRQGVSVVIYDQSGRLFYLAEQLPTANPNDVEIASDPARDCEQVADIVASEENGVIIPINPGEIYMYAFTIKDGKKTRIIKSGKIVADFLPANTILAQ
ncbi:MAG: hypothetical protein K6A36_06785 [Paludibacteraceae bacterium]|nr:hypothetical protein [Paludibacteraceae bacterium]